ncbi:hypothetical protein L9F63_026647, partial [Diploptera punctata]
SAKCSKSNKDLASIIPDDINKTGGLPKESNGIHLGIHHSQNARFHGRSLEGIRIEEPLKILLKIVVELLLNNGVVISGTSILSGWGSTSTTSTASMPAILQTAQLPIVEYNQCLATYGSDSPLDPTNVCTGPLSGGMGACSGDSGGPLVQVKSDGSREIIGIVSWGVIPCGSSNAPSVYVRVSAFIDWINNNIQ